MLCTVLKRRTQSPNPHTVTTERTTPLGARIDDAFVTALRAALQRYLDLMYDCDLSRFDDRRKRCIPAP